MPIEYQTPQIALATQLKTKHFLIYQFKTNLVQVMQKINQQTLDKTSQQLYQLNIDQLNQWLHQIDPQNIHAQTMQQAMHTFKNQYQTSLEILITALKHNPDLNQINSSQDPTQPFNNTLLTWYYAQARQFEIDIYTQYCPN